MFYGQNCSGRFGESRSIISIAGGKEDLNFIKLLEELNIRKIKRDLNETNFLRAINLAKKHSIQVSIVIIQNNVFGKLKNEVCKYPHWFGKLYGIICAKALEPIKDKKILLQMDREYDYKTLDLAANVICKLLKFDRNAVYIRNEGEYPTNRIIVADLFARGCFKGFDCTNITLTKNPDVKDEIQEIFEKIR